jgi:pimeloyl-ACP methyl ester carboxylesterase
MGNLHLGHRDRPPSGWQRQERRPMNLTPSARPVRLRVMILAAVLATTGLLFTAAQAGSAHAVTAPTVRGSTTAWADGPRPTIVLVHGAWADASSWDGVIARLQQEGFTAVAAPNTLRGLSSDSTYLADFLSSIPGPIVLVGHSYGGMVITNAATGNPNVKALVYVDAFIPAKGDTAFGLTGAKPGSCVGSAKAFAAVPYPGAPAGDFDVYLKTGPDLPYPGFGRCFANDLPASEAAILAATQSPIALSAGSAPSGVPAWQTIPSWDVIGTADHVIPPAEQQFMAQRAGARVTKVDASHLSLISRPGAVSRVILDAARATS